MELDNFRHTSTQQEPRHESEEREAFMGEEQEADDAPANDLSGISSHPHPDYSHAADSAHTQADLADTGSGLNHNLFTGSQSHGPLGSNGFSWNNGAQYSHIGVLQGAPVYSSNGDVAAAPWISPWLRLPFITAAVLVTVAIMGAIIGMSIYSAKNHGLVDVRTTDNGQQLFTFQVGISMLWTFLPALLLQGYSLMYGAVVKAACARQPFVELLKNDDDGAAPEKSILLDYGSWIPPWAIIKALQYGHLMLFWTQLVSLFATLLLGPIGSHLFQAASIPQDQPVTFTQSSHFDDDGFDVVTGLSSALDVASATKLYGALLIPWTTNNTSLLPFETSRFANPGQLANISAQTRAYATYLDCMPLGPENYALAYDTSLDAWYFSANDRGCNFGGSSQVLFTSGLLATEKTFAETYRADCDNSVGSSRIILAIALNEKGSTQQFTNASVVSCIPSYNVIEGRAQLVYTESSTFDLVSYKTMQNNTLARPVFANSFESEIAQPRVVAVSDEQATKLGDIVVQYAQKRSPTNYLDGTLLTEAMQAIVTTTFNVMVQTMLVQPGDAKQIEGSITQQKTRLIVVLPVAYTILGTLLVVCIALVWAFWYTSRYDIAQFEECKGLVGPAVILYNGALNAEVANSKLVSHDGRIAEDIAYDLVHSQRVGWKIEQWPDPRRAVLTTTTKARPVRWFRS